MIKKKKKEQLRENTSFRFEFSILYMFKRIKPIGGFFFFWTSSPRKLTPVVENFAKKSHIRFYSIEIDIYINNCDDKL